MARKRTSELGETELQNRARKTQKAPKHVDIVDIKYMANREIAQLKANSVLNVGNGFTLQKCAELTIQKTVHTVKIKCQSKSKILILHYSSE